MQRRAVILLVSLVVLGGVIAAAVVILPAARVQLTQDPSEADHVTLYQNGLAEVRLSRSFNATGGETALALALPPTVVLESVSVVGEGVSVKSVRSATSQTSGIHPGDVVAVHVGDHTYRGMVQAIDGGTLALSTPTGLTYVELAKATAIEVETAEVSAAGPGALDATVTVLSDPGEHDVTVSYLVQGPGWTPSYRLDADEERLAFYATITASDDWRGVTLDIVAGAPHVVYAPPAFHYRAEMKEYAPSAGLADASSFTPSVPLGNLHRYRHEGAIDLARGESVRLLVAQGRAEIVREYQEARTGTGHGGFAGDAIDVQVMERLRIRNDLAEPLPAGTARVYRGGVWVGEDVLPATPAGDEANLTVSTSQDVKGTLTLVHHDSTPSSDTYRYSLTVRNGKGTPIDLRAVLDAPTYRTTILSFEPSSGARTGGSVAWDQAVPAGGSATFHVAYETLKYG